ncbi:MAG: hypothetical protein P4L53_07640 [Candidatus Obscuribacterales bacterium]|nr:hypothetical protein [Candidatus Obscuribacterales bacterium]
MNELSNNDESQECAQMRRQFDLYELDLPYENDDANFEMHFQNCASCRNWLTNWDLVKVSVHKMEDLEVPAMVFDNIMAAVTPLSTTAPVTGFSSGDVASMSCGFGILLLSFIIFASASLDESISWCVSFVLLVAFNQLTKTRTTLGVA